MKKKTLRYLLGMKWKLFKEIMKIRRKFIKRKRRCLCEEEKFLFLLIDIIFTCE